MLKKFHIISKRIFDLVFSIIGILVLLPMLILIAVLIKLDSKGPVLFIQSRLGLNGQVFKILKFRSMIVNAEFTGTGIFNYNNDPRETRVGKILRNYSLDELPQIFNIFIGNMSFVGPRPPITYELGNYDDFTPDLKFRFLLKPGITGYSQINGRNELNWNQKIIFDNEYIKDFYKWGVILDIKVILVTIYKVVKNEGSHELLENSHLDMSRLDESIKIKNK